MKKLNLMALDLGTQALRGTTGKLNKLGLPEQADQESDDDFAERQKQHPQMRPPVWTDLVVNEVIPYSRKGDLKPMLALNQGTNHISYAQLRGKGVFNPASLVDKTMQVDYFQVGERLLNDKNGEANLVTTPNKIINRFIVKPDAAAASRIEEQLALNSLLQFIGQAPAAPQAASTTATAANAAFVPTMPSHQYDDNGNMIP